MPQDLNPFRTIKDAWNQSKDAIEDPGNDPMVDLKVGNGPIGAPPPHPLRSPKNQPPPLDVPRLPTSPPASIEPPPLDVPTRPTIAPVAPPPMPQAPAIAPMTAHALQEAAKHVGKADPMLMQKLEMAKQAAVTQGMAALAPPQPAAQPDLMQQFNRPAPTIQGLEAAAGRYTPSSVYSNDPYGGSRPAESIVPTFGLDRVQMTLDEYKAEIAGPRAKQDPQYLSQLKQYAPYILGADPRDARKVQGVTGIKDDFEAVIKTKEMQDAGGADQTDVLQTTDGIDLYRKSMDGVFGGETMDTPKTAMDMASSAVREAWAQREEKIERQKAAEKVGKLARMPGTSIDVATEMLNQVVERPKGATKSDHIDMVAKKLGIGRSQVIDTIEDKRREMAKPAKAGKAMKGDSPDRIGWGESALRGARRYGADAVAFGANIVGDDAVPAFMEAVKEDEDLKMSEAATADNWRDYFTGKGDFGNLPDKIADLVGSQAPMMLGGYGAGRVTFQAARALGLSSKAATIAALGGSSTAMTPAEFQGQFNEAYKSWRLQGVEDKEARANALVEAGLYSGVAAALEAAPIQKFIPTGKLAIMDAGVVRNAIKRAAITVRQTGEEFTVEGLQALTSQIAGVVAGRAGVEDFDAMAILEEAIAGGLMGGGVGAVGAATATVQKAAAETALKDAGYKSILQTAQQGDAVLPIKRGEVELVASLPAEQREKIVADRRERLEKMGENLSEQQLDMIAQARAQGDPLQEQEPQWLKDRVEKMGGTALEQDPDSGKVEGAKPKFGPFEGQDDVAATPAGNTGSDDAQSRGPRGGVLKKAAATSLAKSLQADIRAKTKASKVSVRAANDPLPSEVPILEAVRDLGYTPLLVEIDGGNVEGQFGVGGRPDVVAIRRGNIGRYATAIGMHEIVGHALKKRRDQPQLWEGLYQALDAAAPTEMRRIEAEYAKRAKEEGLDPSKIAFDEEAVGDMAKILSNRIFGGESDAALRSVVDTLNASDSTFTRKVVDFFNSLGRWALQQFNPLSKQGLKVDAPLTSAKARRINREHAGAILAIREALREVTGNQNITNVIQQRQRDSLNALSDMKVDAAKELDDAAARTSVERQNLQKTLEAAQLELDAIRSEVQTSPQAAQSKRTMLEKMIADTQAKIDAIDSGKAPKPSASTPDSSVSPLAAGDTVQWTSNGVDQFQTPRKITKIINSPDGQLAQVEGSNTYVPVSELTKQPTQESTDGQQERVQDTQEQDRAQEPTPDEGPQAKVDQSPPEVLNQSPESQGSPQPDARTQESDSATGVLDQAEADQATEQSDQVGAVPTDQGVDTNAGTMDGKRPIKNGETADSGASGQSVEGMPQNNAAIDSDNAEAPRPFDDANGIPEKLARGTRIKVGDRTIKVDRSNGYILSGTDEQGQNAAVDARQQDVTILPEQVSPTPPVSETGKPAEQESAADSKQPWEMTRDDMVVEGKRARRAPKGYVFIGELYGVDYEGSSRKPSGPNAGSIGNVYRLPKVPGQPKQYRVLEMNDGWTGRALPGVFRPEHFTAKGRFSGTGGVSARQYTFAKPEESVTPQAAPATAGQADVQQPPVSDAANQPKKATPKPKPVKIVKGDMVKPKTPGQNGQPNWKKPKRVHNVASDGTIEVKYQNTIYTFRPEEMTVARKASDRVVSPPMPKGYGKKNTEDAIKAIADGYPSRKDNAEMIIEGAVHEQYLPEGFGIDQDTYDALTPIQKMAVRNAGVSVSDDYGVLNEVLGSAEVEAVLAEVLRGEKARRAEIAEEVLAGGLNADPSDMIHALLYPYTLDPSYTYKKAISQPVHELGVDVALEIQGTPFKVEYDAAMDVLAMVEQGEGASIEIPLVGLETIPADEGSVVKPSEDGHAPFSIAAWHGTRYDFDRFDLSKIGTGEGAQAYGWGLYFASREEVARHYRNALSRDSQHRLDALTDEENKSVPAWVAASIANDPGVSNIVYHISDFELRVRNSKEELKDAIIQPWVIEQRIRNNEELVKTLRKVLQDAKKSGRARVTQQNTGRLYNVTLAPEPHELLDWDRPLSQQSEKVKAAFASMKGKANPIEETLRAMSINELLRWAKTMDSNSSFDEWVEERAETVHPVFPEELADALIKAYVTEDADGSYYAGDYAQTQSGGSIYKQMAAVTGTDSDASKKLLYLGIRGIRYRDGDSRNLNGQTEAQGVALRLIYDSGMTPDQAVKELKGRRQKSGSKEFAARMTEAIEFIESGKYKDAVGFNYVIFDAADVQIEAKFSIAQNKSKNRDFDAMMAELKKGHDAKIAAVRGQIDPVDGGGFQYDDRTTRDGRTYKSFAVFSREPGPVREQTPWRVSMFDTFIEGRVPKAWGHSNYKTLDDAVKGFVRDYLSGAEGVKPAQFSIASPINSPEFKDFFGDSKVVDADGKPLVVYHGTEQVGHTAFKIPDGLEPGVFATDNPRRAEAYHSYAGRDFKGNRISGRGSGTYPLYMALKNPMRVDWPKYAVAHGWPSSAYNAHHVAILFQDAKRNGHDGIIITNMRDSGDVGTDYIAFSPTQIKSVNNQGAFDKTNPDIRFSLRDDTMSGMAPEEGAGRSSQPNPQRPEGGNPGADTAPRYIPVGDLVFTEENQSSLDQVREWLTADTDPIDIAPLVAVRELSGEYSIVDGHNRAFVASEVGIDRLPALTIDRSSYNSLLESYDPQEISAGMAQFSGDYEQVSRLNAEFGGAGIYDSAEAVAAELAKIAASSNPATTPQSGGSSFSLFNNDADGVASWTDERIDSLLEEFSYPANANRTKAYAAYINPRDFVRLTTPESMADLMRDQAGALRAEDLKAEAQTPYLMVAMDEPRWMSQPRWTVVGHEGRHRMQAMAASGVTTVPVVLRVGSGFEGKPIAAKGIRPENFGGGLRGAGAAIIDNAVPISTAYEQRLRDDFGKDSRVRFSLFNNDPAPKLPWDSTVTGLEGNVSGDLFAAQKKQDREYKAITEIPEEHQALAGELNLTLGDYNLANTLVEGDLTPGKVLGVKQYLLGGQRPEPILGVEIKDVRDGFKQADQNASQAQRDNRRKADEPDKDQTSLFSIAPPTDSKAFRDWSNNAPMVSAAAARGYPFETGTPVVVKSFHGLPDARNFTANAPEGDAVFKTRAELLLNAEDSDRAFFFTENRSVASTYADDRRAFDYQNADPGILSVYVAMQNPMVIDAKGVGWGRRGGPKTQAEQMQEAKAAGHDGIIIQRTRDTYQDTANAPIHNVYVAFDPTQIKSATDNRGTFDASNPDIRFSIAPETATKEFKAWFKVSKVVDENGQPKRAFHGMGRPDRLGSRFRKSRATSGPMAFFTDDTEIAGSYAKGKADNSLEAPDDYAGWFLYKPRGSRNSVPIDRAWYAMTPQEKAKVASLYHRVTNRDEETGDHLDKVNVLDPSEGAVAGKSHWDHVMQREARGNPLRAMVDVWLNSAELFGDERSFLKLLDAAGVDMSRVEYADPNAQYPGIVPVYLAIQNPLNTSEIPSEVVDRLRKASTRKRGSNPLAAADPWDKRTISGKAWMESLDNDIKSGLNHAWTRVPDWVTKTLKDMGYDGIHDTGGKYGGVKHTVWIPFEENQVKSIFNKGTYDPNNADIRFSIAPMESSIPDLDPSIREMYGTLFGDQFNEEGYREQNDRFTKRPTAIGRRGAPGSRSDMGPQRVPVNGSDFPRAARQRLWAARQAFQALQDADRGEKQSPREIFAGFLDPRGSVDPEAAAKALEYLPALDPAMVDAIKRLRLIDKGAEAEVYHDEGKSAVYKVVKIRRSSSIREDGTVVGVSVGKIVGLNNAGVAPIFDPFPVSEDPVSITQYMRDQLDPVVQGAAVYTEPVGFTADYLVLKQPYVLSAKHGWDARRESMAQQLGLESLSSSGMTRLGKMPNGEYIAYVDMHKKNLVYGVPDLQPGEAINESAPAYLIDATARILTPEEAAIIEPLGFRQQGLDFADFSIAPRPIGYTYLDIGHSKGNDLWIITEDGLVTEQDETGDQTHFVMPEAMDSPIRGWVDHGKRMISMTVGLDPISFNERQRQRAITSAYRQLRMLYPGYRFAEFDLEKSVEPRFSIRQTPAGKHVETELMYGAVQRDAMGFFSPLRQFAHDLKQDKLATKQFKGMLSKSPVKKDEVDWSGVLDWLNQREKFTKQELQDFLEENEVRVEQVILGEEARGEVNVGDQGRHGAVEVRENEDSLWYVYDGDERMTPAGEGYMDYDEAERDAIAYLENEVANGAVAPASDAKFEQWQLPGGTNYRELLITLPARGQIVYTRDNVKPLNSNDPLAPHVARENHLLWFFRTPDNLLQISKKKYPKQEDALEYILREKQPDPPLEQNYQSSHFDTPNILAHLRMNDRVDDQGRRVLFLEEVQSDWHQAGRKKGYGQKGVHWKLPNGDGSVVFENEQQAQEWLQRMPQSTRDVYATATLAPATASPGDSVPDAPYKTTWPELALKRAITYAADNGYDAIAWTTGEQQAERYDLSKQVDRVEWTLQADGHDIEVYDLNDKKVVEREALSPSQLADMIGKEAAEKIVEASEMEGVLEGDDLKVGGDGMRSFYDRILPNTANKIGKRYGAKTGASKIDVPGRDFDPDWPELGQRDEAMPAVHSLPLTDKLRDTARTKGMARFSIAAWHGTPHDFDRFDLSKIGTGEGAQAYGHGLYFTDREGIADFYRSKLQKVSRAHSTLDGKRITPRMVKEAKNTPYAQRNDFLNTLHNAMRMGIQPASKDDQRPVIDKEIQELQEEADGLKQRLSEFRKNPPMQSTWSEQDYIDRIEGYESRIKEMKAVKDRLSFVPEKKHGRKYKVTLAPKPDELLDWDKPLSEQSEKVRNALAGSGVGPIQTDADVRAYGYVIEPQQLELSDTTVYKIRRPDGRSVPAVLGGGRLFQSKQEAIDNLNGVISQKDGDSVYRHLSQREGGDRDASALLRSLGIRGIKYLDGSSRNSPQQYRASFTKTIPTSALPKVGGFDAMTALNVAKAEIERAMSESNGDKAAAAVVVREAGRFVALRHGPSERVFYNTIADMLEAGDIEIKDNRNYNYVIFDDADVQIDAKFSLRNDGPTYTDYGHEGGSALWAYNAADQKVITREVDEGQEDQYHGELGLSQGAVVMGRIDHHQEVITMTLGDFVYPLTPSSGRRIEHGAKAALKTLQKDYPDYQVKTFDADGFLREFATNPYDGGHGSFSLRNPELKTGFELDPEGLWFQFRRGQQDKFLAVKMMQESLKRQGGVIDPASDVYRWEELFHGKVGKDMEEVQKTLYSTLGHAVHKSGINEERLGILVIARHAEERNNHIRKINPFFNPTLDDPLFDGLVEEHTGEIAGSGMPTSEARKIIKEAKASGEWAKAQPVFEAHDDINAARLDLIEQAGLETADAIARAKAKYRYYTPLMGHSGKTMQDGHEALGGVRIGSEDPVKPRRTTGYDARGKELTRSLGRVTIAENPLVTSIMLMNNTIVHARQNEVGKAFLKLVRDNPDPQLWEVNKLEERFYLDERVQRVKRKKDQMGKYMDDHKLVVYEDGKEVWVHIEHDSLARAMKALGPAHQNMLVRGAGTLTRLFSALNTQWSPEFIPTNFARDLQTAIVHLTGEVDARMAKDVSKDVAGALRGIYVGQRDDARMEAAKQPKMHRKSVAEWIKWWEEFQEAGAKVNFFGLKDFDAQANDLVKSVRRLNESKGKAYTWGMLRRMAEFVSDANGAVENAVRLSAYKHARLRGWSKADAASLARNLTVNFNRKGENGVALNAFYAFFNAGIQGSARMASSAVKSKKTRAIMGAIVAQGAAMGFLNYLLAGDDEDGVNYWAKIDPSKKARNWILMLPWLGLDENGQMRHIMIPLPYGYNVFHTAGTSIADVATGVQGAGQAASNTLVTALDSFNPIGQSASLVQMVAPTVIEPFAQVGENKNWHGGPIYPAEFPGDRRPDSQKYFSSVSAPSRYIAAGLNAITGGDEVTPGYVDVSPETLDHAFDSILGSVGGFTRRTTSVGLKALTGEEIEAREIPFYRKVIGSTHEYTINRDFSEFKSEADALDQRLRHYERTGQNAKAQRLREQNGDMLRLKPEMGQINSLQRDLRDRVELLVGLPATKEGKLEVIEQLKAQIGMPHKVRQSSVQDLVIHVRDIQAIVQLDDKGQDAYIKALDKQRLDMLKAINKKVREETGKPMRPVER